MRGRSARNLGWFLLPLFVSGCAGNPSSATMPLARSIPMQGTVRIDVIAQANPQWTVVHKIDQAIRNARESPGPHGAGAPSAPKQSASPREVGSYSRRERQLVAIQTRRLSVLQQEILANLDVRLRRADNQRLEGNQARLNAEAEQTYLSRVEAINEQANHDTDQATAQDRAKIVNLVAKINALTADLQPPPTAPDGYWKARLTIRQAELSEMESQRRSLIGDILALREQSRRDLRAQLQRQADASFDEAVASATARRAALLAATRQRLQAQTADILASSKALDFEADAAASPFEKTPQSTASNVINGVPGTTLVSWTARGDLSALQRERERLQEQIRQQTLQTVIEVARSRNIVIVGYRRQVGVKDITDDLLNWVKADRWG